MSDPIGDGGCALPIINTSRHCRCPEHGSWIHADDVKRNTRLIDVALNGEEGAAEQASLCDIAGQVQRIARETGRPILQPQAQHAPEGGEVVAWLIEWRDPQTSDPTPTNRRNVFLHNAIGDYRDFDAGAKSTPLYASPQPAPQAVVDEADELLRDLGLDPARFRSEGGHIMAGKVRAAIMHPDEYSGLYASPPPAGDVAREYEAGNHDEALQLAYIKRGESNLARCYIELAAYGKQGAVDECNCSPMQAAHGHHFGCPALHSEATGQQAVDDAMVERGCHEGAKQAGREWLDLDPENRAKLFEHMRAILNAALTADAGKGGG